MPRKILGVVCALVFFVGIACNSILGNEAGHLAASQKDSGAARACTTKADCASGELCLFGSCSHTCRRDGDCPAGFRCLNTDEGAACVNDTQAACTNASCPQGATCSDGECRSTCIDSNGCADDQTCGSKNACVGLHVEHDPGAATDAASPGSGGRANSGGTANGGRTANTGGTTNGGGTGNTGGRANSGGTVSSGGTLGGGGTLPEAGVSDDAGVVGGIATLGAACGKTGILACVGHAQPDRYACQAGRWTNFGSCSVGTNCDTSGGKGVCATIVPECVGQAPNTVVCQGPLNIVACGPDLVTTIPKGTCSDTEGCISGGICGKCTKNERTCSSTGPGCETNITLNTSCGTDCGNLVQCSGATPTCVANACAP